MELSMPNRFTNEQERMLPSSLVQTLLQHFRYANRHSKWILVDSSLGRRWSRAYSYEQLPMSRLSLYLEYRRNMTTLRGKFPSVGLSPSTFAIIDVRSRQPEKGTKLIFILSFVYRSARRLAKVWSGFSSSNQNLLSRIMILLVVCSLFVFWLLQMSGDKAWTHANFVIFDVPIVFTSQVARIPCAVVP